MFTGLIEAVGEIVFLGPASAAEELHGHTDVAQFRAMYARESGELAQGSVDALVGIESPFTSELALGDSVAVNGCCLTVIRCTANVFWAYAMPETLRLTTLGEKKIGAKVNLERALLATSRLGGHLVSGHVDGLGTLEQIRPGERWTELRFSLPKDLARQVALKGSIAIDGTSLTVTHAGERHFEVSIIPHTSTHTTLGLLREGDNVNLETDVIAKYVQRLLQKG